MAVMDDDKVTRRKRHHHNNNEQKTSSPANKNDTPLLLVASASNDIDDDNNSEAYNKKRNKKLKRRKRRRRDDDPPFYVLVIQVGITLLLTSIASFRLYRWKYPALTNLEEPEYEYYDDDVNEGNYYEEQDQSENLDAAERAKLDELLQAARDAAAESKVREEPPPPPPIPHFDLSDASKWDAFGIIEAMDTSNQKDDDKHRNFWRAASGMRQRFAELYGGENAARMLLDQGLTTFPGVRERITTPEDIVATSCRLHIAKVDQRPFRMVFGGYSVTVGRGNRFQDSFPFQLEKDLGVVMNLAGIDLQVNNAAIGGIPSFPYGWCFENFWGSQPDVVSWDYSMNEAGDVPEGLEAYIRHILSTYSENPPKLIVKDTHMASHRRDVLGAYQALLKDPVVIHTDPAVKPMLERKEEHRPIGFQEWRKFGAPIGAPGQTAHHPGLKEHQLIGWILAMHFLTATEYLMSQSDTDINQQCGSSTSTSQKVVSLPSPVSGTITNTTNMIYNSILFGHPQDPNNNGNDEQQWHMNPIHCRTTFQPILNGDLSELVVSGTTAEDLEVLLPKSQMYYNQGWTFDVSEKEKAAKRKLSLFPDGLGFVDSKEAYYGIYESKKMRLLIPFEEESSLSSPGAAIATPEIGKRANDWFESMVLCQVNEKRDFSSFAELPSCNLATDIGVVIGGINATASLVPSNNFTTDTRTYNKMMNDAGTLYLGQQMCMHIQIPKEAVLTSHNQLDKNPEDEPLEKDIVGMMVDIFVTNPHIAHISQACSISHVIWEQKWK